MYGKDSFSFGERADIAYQTHFLAMNRARNNEPTLVCYWGDVYDAGPISHQYLLNVSRYLSMFTLRTKTCQGCFAYYSNIEIAATYMYA